MIAILTVFFAANLQAQTLNNNVSPVNVYQNSRDFARTRSVPPASVKAVEAPAPEIRNNMTPKGTTKTSGGAGVPHISNPYLSAAPAPEAAESAVSSAPVTVDRPTGGATVFKWAKAPNGWGYCYEYTRPNEGGFVLNMGNPVPNSFCEAIAKPYAWWGQAKNTFGYCYLFTPEGYVLNNGQPVEEWQCNDRAKAYFKFSAGANGYTLCYLYTPNNYLMNEGISVDEVQCKQQLQPQQ